MTNYPNCYLEGLYLKNLGKKVEFEREYVYPYDKIKIVDGDIIKLSLLENTSGVPQAVDLSLDKFIEFNDAKSKVMAFWDTGQEKVFEIKLKTKKGILKVDIGWKEGENTYFGRGNTGFKVKDMPDGSRTYYSNYGFSNLKFDGLVFNIKFLSGKKVESLMDET